VLVVEGRSFEHERNYPEAVRNYVTLLRLGVHMCEDPGLIQRSAGLSCWNLGDRCLSSLLTREKLDLDTLKKLLDELEALPERFSDYHLTVAIEGESFTQALRADLEDEGLEGHLPAVQVHLEEYWSKLGQEEVSWQRLAEVSGSEKEALAKQLALEFFWGCLGPVVHGRIMYARAEARIQALRIVAGLNSYKLATGSWPERVTALESDYLATVPLDPFSGEAFIYKAGKGEWILYSIDWNLKDDGGADGDYPRPWPVKDMVYRNRLKGSPTSTGEKRSEGKPD